jgi:hypothetical protein
MLDGGGGGGGGEAASLFPYAEDDNLSASPATISGLADGIDGVAGNLEVLNPDIDTAHRPALTGTAGVLHSVAATAPQPTKNNINQVLLATLCAAGATRVFGTDGVEAYNGHVDDIRSEYYRRKAEIMASDCGVPAASYPEGATQEQRSSIDSDRAADVSSARTSAVTALVRELQGRQDTFKDDPLDAQATTAANRLEQGPTDQVIQDLYAAGGLPLATVAAFPGLNLKLEGGNLPSDLAAMSPEELASYLIDHPEITDPNILLNLDDEVEEEIGRQLAEYTRTHMLPFPIGDESVNKLNSALDRFGLGVQAQFIKELGGEDTLEVVTALGIQAHDDNGNRMALLNNIREAVGNATAGPFLEESEQRQLADEFVNAIEDYQEKWLINSEEVRGVESPSLALSWLLKDQYHGTEFLDTLGDRLDTFERNHIMRGGWQAMGNEGYSYEFIQNMFGEDDREAAFDPMASYMSSLGENGEASLQFFTEGDNRQEYWLKERFWGHDDFDSVLSALDSATTDEGNLEDPDAAREAAQLMSSAVEYLVNREDNFGGNGEDFVPGDVGDEGTEHLAHMISTYMAAVDYYTSPDGLQGEGDYAGQVANLDLPGLGRLNDMPVFEKSELAKLVQVAVSTDTGFTEMREGVSAYQNLNLQVAVETGRDMQDVANSDGRLEGFFLKQVGDVEIEEAKDKDAQAQAWIDLGKSLTGAIPMPQGKVAGAVVGLLADNATELTGGAVEDALTKNAEGVIDRLREGEIPTSFEDRRNGMAATLYEAGGITRADLDALAARADGQGRPQATPEQMDEWFGDGFPTREEINANPTLEALISDAVENEGISHEGYWQAYESELTNEFGE